MSNLKKPANAIDQADVFPDKLSGLFSLIGESSDMIWSINSRLEITWCNEAFAEFFLQKIGSAVKIGDPVTFPFEPNEQAAIKSIHTQALNEKNFYSELPIIYGGNEALIGFSFFSVSGSEKEIQLLCNTKILKQRDENHSVLLVSEFEKKEGLEALTSENIWTTVSHEIRTPLNAIIGVTHLLKNSVLSEKQRELVNTLEYSGENLLALINNILDFSKITEGTLALVETDFDLHFLLDSIHKSYLSQAEEKGLSLELVLSPYVPKVVKGDRNRLVQVLSNLLSNAIKFTSKGKILLSVNTEKKKKTSAMINFSVLDTGIGMPVEKQRMIFENPLKRSNEPIEWFSGIGLGLAVSRSLLKMMGGELELESVPGIGSVFSFTIDLRFGKLKKKVTSRTIEGVRVLFVEDSPANLQIGIQFLEDWGCLVDVARNGQEAVIMARSNEYHIILMDLNMPVMDGYTATRLIRNSGGPRADIPVLAVSAASLEDIEQRIRQAGVTDYVSKPFHPDVLYSKMVENLSQDVLSAIRPKEGTDLEERFPYLVSLVGLDKVSKILNLAKEACFQALRDVRGAVNNQDEKGIRRGFHTLKPNLKYMEMQEELNILGVDYYSPAFLDRLKILEEKIDAIKI